MNDRDFKRGVWYAVEYLVNKIDQPNYGKELVKSSHISLEEARQFVKESGTGNADALVVLYSLKTWDE